MSFLEKEKDLFFVEVKEPTDVRKSMLEAQKIVVESLQRYENIKFLRANKLENINRLKGILKESSKLFSDLKAALPQSEIKEAKVEEKYKIVKKEGKKEVEKKKVVKKSMSELEKLESELSSIESKLSSLR